MKFFTLLLSLAAVSNAAPTGIFDNNFDFSEDLLDYYGKVSQYIDKYRQNPGAAYACDVSKIALPSYAAGLADQPSGLKPKYVALGRGTQNYTCADSTKETTPTAIGAVADLFNATCIAANYPDLMELMPNAAYRMSLPTDTKLLSSLRLPLGNMQLLGHHFFHDATTPEFNLDTTIDRQFGVLMTNKVSQLKAPSNAFQGQNGAVAWLYLKTVAGTVGDYKAVYRVNTASGAAPKTCEGQPPSFEMQYSANYYFFD
ncbi:Protein of unknown function DUF3455 [Penicillium chermesinum]|uniref:Malate dehydrogenase n=1 Tax=Penicillium chermesinum TaxID=63820 RepID=A0A9W9PID0_9EURO|nr:Protein of unknown function DUF3455 [Penicillium chermesinum]KAJ5247368.1 Protein of unknown function DUF3455 [Penicillium chermesinum]